MNEHDENLDDDQVIEEEDIVTFKDEEGREYACVVLAISELGNAEYAMLAPVAQVNADDDDTPLELFLFRYELGEDDVEIFSYIDDEETYEAVREMFEGLLPQ